MSIMKEFKEFAGRGNVIDLAVGVVVGTAFGRIVSSFVSDIIMPPIGLLTGGVDFANWSFVLKKAVNGTAEVTVNYGAFLNNVLDFLIISFSIFIVIKQLNRFKKKEEKKPLATPEDVKLLTEIRDLLRGINNEELTIKNQGKKKGGNN
ncbi:MAG TPA: large conductance mechanosensitive channel protein MscL [Candidatus Moranbacteria bacterium]|nr:large conductance mechanosensitive channel protein MscL [Candidatus Moranbacteria bacterium]